MIRDFFRSKRLVSKSFLGVAIVFLSSIQCTQKEAAVAPPLAIIPQPSHVQADQGSFTINKETKLYTKDEGSEGVAAYLVKLISEASVFTLTASKMGDADAHNSIVLEISGKEAKGHYSLHVSADQIHIQASDATGLFYGVQTLRQLLPSTVEAKQKTANSWSVPAVSIEDEPAFAWRGMHLDVSRHFFSVDFIKQFIDRLALYKFNRLHLHLTDDQGWRLQINAYPQLTEKGAWRIFNNQDSTCLKKAETDSDFALPQEFLKEKNGVKVYGGFYTQDDIREIVAYASERLITIVPEIDMPGHMDAAISSSPDLTCIDAGGWGKLFTVPLCPCEETTYEFVEKVLTEVAGIFPGEYIHIGADEVDESSWLKSKPCAALLKKEGWTSSRQLHSYFVNRVNKIVQRLGKKTIGWDEIIDGDVDSSITVMYWRGWVPDAPARAAHQGHNVIMSPTSHCYFDYEQDEKTIENVYMFNPVLPDVKGNDIQKVIGLQANIWTEYIPTVARLDFMTMPRMIALAEAGWSTRKDWKDFDQRLTQHYSRLDEMKIKYKLPDLPGLKKHVVFTDTAQLALTIPNGLTQIRYTTDGTTPDITKNLYTKPLHIDSTTVIKLLTLGVGGRSGNRYTIRFEKQDYLPSVDGKNVLPGLTCRYFEGAYNSVQAIAQKDLKKEAVLDSVAFPTFSREGVFGLVFDGFINVPTEGIYTFYLASDDGIVLQIGDRVVVSNDGFHGPKEAAGQIALRKGLHAFDLKYFDGGGGKTLKLLYEGPGISKQSVPSGTWKHVAK